MDNSICGKLTKNFHQTLDDQYYGKITAMNNLMADVEGKLGNQSEEFNFLANNIIEKLADIKSNLKHLNIEDCNIDQINKVNEEIKKFEEKKISRNVMIEKLLLYATNHNDFISNKVQEHIKYLNNVITELPQTLHKVEERLRFLNNETCSKHKRLKDLATDMCLITERKTNIDTFQNLVSGANLPNLHNQFSRAMTPQDQIDIWKEMIQHILQTYGKESDVSNKLYKLTKELENENDKISDKYHRQFLEFKNAHQDNSRLLVKCNRYKAMLNKFLSIVVCQKSVEYQVIIDDFIKTKLEKPSSSLIADLKMIIQTYETEKMQLTEQNNKIKDQVIMLESLIKSLNENETWSEAVVENVKLKIDLSDLRKKYDYVSKELETYVNQEKATNANGSDYVPFLTTLYKANAYISVFDENISLRIKVRKTQKENELLKVRKKMAEKKLATEEKQPEVEESERDKLEDQIYQLQYKNELLTANMLNLAATFGVNVNPEQCMETLVYKINRLSL
ncbi:hypothetical protein SNEBB_009280 [Seison nebaliae]|nr:hypothetical protein SNEBB_009280 [Seison nebaliae]